MRPVFPSRRAIASLSFPSDVSRDHVKGPVVSALEVGTVTRVISVTNAAVFASVRIDSGTGQANVIRCNVRAGPGLSPFGTD